MGFIFQMMMNYWAIKNIEAYHENKEADLAFLIIFNAIASLAFGSLAGEYMVM